MVDPQYSKYKVVDINATNKLSRQIKILSKQQDFVRSLFEYRSEGKVIYYLDETSVSLWSSIKNKTWTDGTIKLTYQAKRGINLTVIGAVGGVASQVEWISSVERRTSKEGVRRFLSYLFAEVPHPSSKIVIVFDNHSSHHSRYV